MAWIEFRTPQRRSVARANGQCACLIKRPHLQAHLWPSCADQFLGRVLIEGVDEPKSARRGLPWSGFPGSSGCPGRGIRRLRAAARFACADRPGAGAMSAFGGKADHSRLSPDVRFRGVKRTLVGHSIMSAFDPKRTLTGANRFPRHARKELSRFALDKIFSNFI